MNLHVRLVAPPRIVSNGGCVSGDMESHTVPRAADTRRRPVRTPTQQGDELEQTSKTVSRTRPYLPSHLDFSK
jgi:hypothetical protein